jgi:hypothetical protein
MKQNQLEWIDDDNVCQCGTPSTNSTMSIRCHENYKVGVERHESALMTHEKMQSSHHHTCTVPTMHAHSEESGSPYDTIQRLSTDAMRHPQRLKSLTLLFLSRELLS